VAVDAAGCALTGLVAALAPQTARTVVATAQARWLTVCALFGTAAMMDAGIRNGPPARRGLHVAAAVNGMWVAACLRALPREDRIGTALVGATAALDAGAGLLQLALRPSRS